MKYYRLITPNVTAVQWTGDNINEIKEFLKITDITKNVRQAIFFEYNHWNYIASLNQFIVFKDGELSIWMPGQFITTYEVVARH